jgi:hypothetical protein
MAVSVTTVTQLFCDICDSTEEYERREDAEIDAARHDEMYHNG